MREPRPGPDARTGARTGDADALSEADRHEHVERMHREGRLTDREAHRAHRLADAGRYDELESLLRVKAAADAGARGVGMGTLFRVLVVILAGILLVDFVIGLL